ncbi:MAG: AraC family transcriptional regulator [Bacteroidales bacterium]|nr:AraC family transcriptional regulator [Bacteroidales bacterium]
MPSNSYFLDISRVPSDFGVGRYQDLLVMFDNLNRDMFSYFNRYDPFPVKNNTFFALTVLEGSVHILVNLHDIVLRKGQSLAMMPGCILQSKEMSSDLKFCGIMVEQNYVESMRKNLGFHVDLTYRYYNYSVHEMPGMVMEDYMKMYRMLSEELASEDYTFKKEVIQRYCEIWILKGMSFGRPEVKSGFRQQFNRREQIFHDFLTLLEQNYRRERSISYYAGQMCLTPKYLSTVIKEVSGKHGMQWIDEYVVLEAKALLRDGHLSVKQVSDQLNFPSQSMFGRFFKKMTGYSPKVYKML